MAEVVNSIFIVSNRKEPRSKPGSISSEWGLGGWKHKANSQRRNMFWMDLPRNVLIAVWIGHAIESECKDFSRTHGGAWTGICFQELSTKLPSFIISRRECQWSTVDGPKAIHFPGLAAAIYPQMPTFNSDCTLSTSKRTNDVPIYFFFLKK